eukprot:COSAG01_NODE_18_length_39884_cov_245.648184_7_plen_89_part_00
MFSFVKDCHWNLQTLNRSIIRELALRVSVRLIGQLKNYVCNRVKRFVARLLGRFVPGYGLRANHYGIVLVFETEKRLWVPQQFYGLQR